ncbi:MAG: hypothetical protein HY555_05895 [Euryarchaeota archaeon]|nr:hypothetical protein [Euryarchaeota archaeon]
MRPALFLVLLAVLGIGIGFLALTLSRGPEPQPIQDIASALTQRDAGQGGVTISVVYATPEYFNARGEAEKAQEYELDKYLVFTVAMDTHSVDLSPYKMEAITFLRDGNGKEYPAKDWRALSDSSHHRSGVVRFQKIEGKALEVVIKGVAGEEERVFRWP